MKLSSLVHLYCFYLQSVMLEMLGLHVIIPFSCFAEVLVSSGKTDLSLQDVARNTALHLACSKVRAFAFKVIFLILWLACKMQTFIFLAFHEYNKFH